MWNCLDYSESPENVCDCCTCNSCQGKWCSLHKFSKYFDMHSVAALGVCPCIPVNTQDLEQNKIVYMSAIQASSQRTYLPPILVLLARAILFCTRTTHVAVGRATLGLASDCGESATPRKRTSRAGDGRIFSTDPTLFIPVSLFGHVRFNLHPQGPRPRLHLIS